MKKTIFLLALGLSVGLLVDAGRAQINVPPIGIAPPPVSTQPMAFINGAGTANGPIRMVDGSLSAPGLTDSTGTSGLRVRAAGAWSYVTGGADTVQFDSGGLKANSVILDVSNQDVVIARDAANRLALKNSTTAQGLRIYQTTTGPVFNEINATAPTISSGFGTSPSIVANSTAFTFRVNVGTGGVATSGVVGVPAATNGWNCQVQDMTNNVATRQTASTTTTITFTAAAAWTASDILVATCVAF